MNTPKSDYTYNFSYVTWCPRTKLQSAWKHTRFLQTVHSVNSSFSPRLRISDFRHAIWSFTCKKCYPNLSKILENRKYTFWVRRVQTRLGVPESRCISQTLMLEYCATMVNGNHTITIVIVIKVYMRRVVN
jgi:hypothetical protein